MFAYYLEDTEQTPELMTMPKSIRPIFHLCLVVIATFALCNGASAAIEESEEPNDGKVDVYYSAEAVVDIVRVIKKSNASARS